MNIRPVQGPPAPSPIPTAAEVAADPTLAAPAPSSNRAPRRAPAMLLGAGLLSALLRPAATSADDTPPPAVTLSDASLTDAELAALATSPADPAPAPSAIPLVAPILQQALDEDGRGVFGCLAIDPPHTLSEADALDIIRQEFAQAGITLRPARDLGTLALLPADRPGTTPRELRDITAEPEELTDKWGSYRTDPPAWTTGTRKWIFDLATEDGTLLVEYLSCRDHEKLDWEKNVQITTNADGSVRGITIGGSSVHTYDFPQTAADLRDRFESRPSGTPATVALFFDPLASSGIDWDALRTAEEFQAAQSRRDTARATLPALAREKLRAQISHFLSWARRENLLPSTSP